MLLLHESHVTCTHKNLKFKNALKNKAESKQMKILSQSTSCTLIMYPIININLFVIVILCGLNNLVSIIIGFYDVI